MESKLFDFSEALRKLKSGSRVAREGWNGKGMFIYKVDGHFSDGVFVRPYLAMKDAQGFLVTGWLASQTDLLAEDWMVVIE